MKVIETRDLTKFYGQNRGIENVNLTVEKGDFFGFIGPNGAGKSTTIRALLGLIFPSSGSASVFGLDAVKNKNEILGRVGYLPSETSFYRGMRVKELLDFSARMKGVNCEKEAKILCERLQLNTTRKINELSYGNRKKVGIVCALQSNPELLILDEPTGGLDPLIQKEFYTILSERNAQGTTVFLSSHILSEVARYCKGAAVIKSGKILASDRMEKLGHSNAKKVVLRGIKANQNDFPWEGKWENDSVSFLYGGAPRELIARLSAFDFEDFTVSDPDLEEIFLHYYEKEEK